MMKPEDAADERIPHPEVWLIRLRNLIFKTGVAPELAIYIFMGELNWKLPPKPKSKKEPDRG